MAEVQVLARPAHSQGLGILDSIQHYADGITSVRPANEIEQEVEAWVEEKLQDAKNNRPLPKAAAIPTFFKPKPRPNSLGSLIKAQAQIRKEQIKHETVLDEEQIRQIWYWLEDYSLPEEDDEQGQRRINYDGFSQVATRCREMYGPQLDSYFRASVFSMFEHDPEGCIPVSAFLAYVTRRSQMTDVRLRLSHFDPNNTGQLSEAALESFLASMAPELTSLEEMEDGFLRHYSRIAARKVLFLHGRNGGVRIRELANSACMQELWELRSAHVNDNQLMANWFSLQSTRRVYNTFQTLDGDMNGTLSRQEFSQIANGTMSQLFIARIFEEHVMKQRQMLGRREIERDEMDLVAFTDFVLAWDNRSQPAAIKYFFSIMDLKKQGCISPAEVYTFFKEIHVMWVRMGEYADLSIYDVVDEIIDMIKPKNSPNITAEDLRASGMSGVFFSILSDVKQFFDYNYRENLIHQDDDNQ